MGDTLAVMTAEKPIKNFNLIESLEIRDHFPFDEIRPAQETAFKAIEKAYRENKKFVVLEIPTGGGKSGIGVDAGSWAKTMPKAGGFEPGAYYCSPQKTLTKQAMDDFRKNGLVELKGKSNYTCGYKFSEEEGGGEMDCETADFMYEAHAEPGGCHGYKAAKSEFMNTPLGITNFAYYLAETSTAHQLEDRTMLVLDEAHGTEEHILGLASIELTRYRCEEAGIDFASVPYIEGNAVGMGTALDWLNETFRPAAVQTINTLKDEAQKRRESKMQKEAARLQKKANGMERFVGQLDMFLKSEDRKKWLVWSESEVTKCPRCRAKLRPGTVVCWKKECRANIPLRPAKMIVKPLTATLFADEILFSKARMVILMSGTILDFDTFLRNLGISPDNAVCVALPSDFPVENRRILYKPVADMSSKTIEFSKPLIAAECAKLLRKHQNEKGIIHTHTYAINRYVVDYLRTHGFQGRIITHEEGIPNDRERCVQEHIDRVGEPTVICSPSMTEGLDLKDDLSRFSIICKVPYPFLSNYVKARMELDKDWYNWLTALKIEQATGRSNRHKNDKATHYIIDAGFGSFCKRASKMFSKWWADSIFFPGDYDEDW